MDVFDHMILSDGWFVHGDDAWFMSAASSELFHVDMVVKKVNYIGKIPQKNIPWRSHPICIKYCDYIYCLPDNGECIWRYTCFSGKWDRIFIKKNKFRLRATKYQIDGKNAWIFSYGLQCVLKLDLEKGRVSDYYKLPIKKMEFFGEVCFEKGEIYVISSQYQCAYKFDKAEKNFSKMMLPIGKDVANTVSFDGNKFLISGRSKKIYLCGPNMNLKEEMELPKDFGAYDFGMKSSDLLDCSMMDYEFPLFHASFLCGGYFWLIPYYTNKIIYLDGNNIHGFNISGEEETRVTIENRIINHKYLVEYVKNDRFIGLYSIKHECIYEIDALSLRYKRLKYVFENSSLIKLVGGSFCVRESKEYGITKLIKELNLPRYKFRRELELNKLKGMGENGKRIYSFIVNNN